MNSFERSKRIEAHLMEAVEESKILYESAKEQYQQALDLREDLGRTHPDGALTYRLALRNRDQAFGNYTWALLRFNRLILHREFPAEGDASTPVAKETSETDLAHPAG
jgi:hypothetical protein